MTSLVARPFDQAWTLEDTQAYIQRSENRSPAPPGHLRRIDEKLRAAVGGHLLYLGEQGQLAPPPHSKDLSLRWLDSWNRLGQGGNQDNAMNEAAAYKIDHALSFLLFLPNRSPQELHDTVVKKMQEGDFSYHEMGEPQECSLTGAKLFVRLNNWQPELGTLTPRPGGKWFEQDFVPIVADQFQAPGVECVQIPVPSGELLIHDWFRIPEFTQLTKQVDEESGTEDDFSAQGRAKNTRAYAQKLEFACVFGGSDPAVVMDEGVLRVGVFNADGSQSSPQSGKQVGRVSTQLRACTMIDKQVLVGLLAKTLPMEEALSRVENLLREEREIIRVKIAPGTYHLYSSGRREVFAEKFASQEVSMHDFAEPMLVLSPNPLTLQEPAPGKSPRPCR